MPPVSAVCTLRGRKWSGTSPRCPGGQRAKLLLTKANLTGAQVLILDEPSRNFSPLSAGAVADELARFSGAILFVSHDRAFIERVATAVFELTEKGLVPREKENLFF